MVNIVKIIGVGNVVGTVGSIGPIVDEEKEIVGKGGIGGFFGVVLKKNGVAKVNKCGGEYCGNRNVMIGSKVYLVNATFDSNNVMTWIGEPCSESGVGGFCGYAENAMMIVCDKGLEFRCCAAKYQNCVVAIGSAWGRGCVEGSPVHLKGGVGGEFGRKKGKVSSEKVRVGYGKHSILIYKSFPATCVNM